MQLIEHHIPAAAHLVAQSMDTQIEGSAHELQRLGTLAGTMETPQHTIYRYVYSMKIYCLRGTCLSSQACCIRLLVAISPNTKLVLSWCWQHNEV